MLRCELNTNDEHPLILTTGIFLIM